MKILEIAQLCHEANRAICVASGDLSQAPYDQAPQWQIDSAISGVKFVLNNIDAGPDSNHVNWMKDKLADGWKYGPVKNVEKKEHPCMVPYEELPFNQKVKDHVFRTLVLALDNMGLVEE